MKFLKLFSIVALSAVSMTMFAAINAQANIAVRGNISGLGDEIDLYQDDASSQLVTDIPATQPSSINMYVVINSTNYSSVKQANLEGLQIVFKANTKETGYTLKFNNVSGEEYFLQKGEDAANLIPMTEDYAFTCEKSEQIIFTVVKQTAPQKDYTRDAATVIGNWYTICVPGGVDVEEYAPVMDVYTVAGYDAAQGLAVDPLVGAMQPGVPYIFQAKAELIEFDYNEEVGALSPQGGEDYNYLTGTFEDMQTENVAYVVANNKLNWAAAGTTVPAYRAYLNYPDITDGTFPVVNPQLPAPGRKFLPAPKGVTTDLEGATVNGLQNGTYMVNGQLVIVKDGKTFNVLGL